MTRYVILGTSHLIQESSEFEQAVHQACHKHSVEVLAEENTYSIESTAARRASKRLCIPYLQVDPYPSEWVALEIDYEMSIRQQLQGQQDIRLSHADDVRERVWLNRIEAGAKGKCVLVICGYLHVDFFAEKVREHGGQVLEKGTLPTELGGRKPEKILSLVELEEHAKSGPDSEL